MAWDKNYKKEQQPKLTRKLVIVSRATILPVGNTYKGVVLVQNEEKTFDAFITRDLLTFIKALDKAHYANANYAQYGHELPAEWEQGLQGLTLAELKEEGFVV